MCTQPRTQSPAAFPAAPSFPRGPGLVVALLLLAPLSPLHGQLPGDGGKMGEFGVPSSNPGLFPVTALPVLDLPPARAAAGSPRLLGAGVGFVVGAGATWAVLNQGASTAPCDQDQNQDAWGRKECLGAYALGGLVGAGVGALVGGIVRSHAAPLEGVHLGWGPGERGGRVSFLWRSGSGADFSPR
jgi:hypothetical protein